VLLQPADPVRVESCLVIGILLTQIRYLIFSCMLTQRKMICCRVFVILPESCSLGRSSLSAIALLTDRERVFLRLDWIPKASMLIKL
jgi:hypothetical protein